jgi:hypothetical protein
MKIQPTRRLLVALVCAVGLCVTMPLAAAPTLGPLKVLSVRSRDNRSVALAAGLAGSRLFAVWDGVVEGHRRIVMRERVEGEWLPEVILDGDPAAQPNSASVATDSFGNPWVAWRARIEGRFQPVVATRIGGQWIHWLPTEECPLEKGQADEISIAVTEAGLTYIAWQEAIGAGYRVRAAYLDDESGLWQVSELSASSEGYGLYPTIVMTSATPSVVWYRANAADFALVERAIGPTAGEHLPQPVPGLQAMPANRFPTILRDSAGRLAGLWYDEVDLADRIFLGVQGAPDFGAGEVVDQRPDADNREVAGTAAPGRLVIAWVAETSKHGTEVMVAHGVNPPLTQITVSEGEKDWFARPTAAPLQAGAAVAWESSAEFGGSGDIFFREIRF